MSFQLSPGVKVREIDLTTVVPAVATSEAAIGGVFRWGPVEKPLLVTDENQLVDRFGKPTNFNAETFFTAASFLAYSNALYVSRATDATLTNAAAGPGANTVLIKSEDHFEVLELTDEFTDFAAKYPGAIGNSLRISVCGSPAAFSTAVETLDANNTLNFVVGSNTATTDEDLSADFSAGDVVKVGNTTVGHTYLKVSGATATEINFEDRFNLAEDFSTNTVDRLWEFWDVVDTAPGISLYQEKYGNGEVDEVHVVVVDEGGEFSGVPGSILEVFQGLSRATGAKTADGGTNFVHEVLNQRSRYVWALNDITGLPTAAPAVLVAPTLDTPYNQTFVNGADSANETAIATGSLINAYNVYRDAEEIDISLVLTGKSNGATLANYLIDNVAQYRMDCVVFVSPEKLDVVNNTFGDIEQDVVDFRNRLRSTSYAVMDSGYKYMYDKYNDVYRWVPMNGDTAGLCAHTDDVRDAWWSPAGFNRGHLRNIVKLAWNPNKAQRDVLYKNGVNPMVNFPGQGIVMYGDKTLLAKPSAFDRINVRRLFIVLEKAIATASKFTLFEFNDEFTRASFVNLITPFLRDVQGRRGIYDFRVVCDETNNTGEVIDRNEFIGDIYIKPARSINFITLNFVAVRTGVEFEEVVGQF